MASAACNETLLLWRLDGRGGNFVTLEVVRELREETGRDREPADPYRLRPRDQRDRKDRGGCRAEFGWQSGVPRPSVAPIENSQDVYTLVLVKVSAALLSHQAPLPILRHSHHGDPPGKGQRSRAK